MAKIEDIFGNPDAPLTDIPNPEDEGMDGKTVTGKIIKVKEESGYGFIVTPSLRFTRIFFHWSALLQSTLNFKELAKGMEVEFTLKRFPQSWRAIKIRVTNANTTAED